MNEVLRIADVGQSFDGTTVLTGIHLTLEAGERLAVIGSSGSGKTTLLRLIAGLAMVFQGLALFPHLRALDQIAFATSRRAGTRRGGIAEARALLERIGLGHRATARLDELSGGERQRIALARAIAQKPRLILMDEPFSSLDDQKRGEMRDLLRSLLDSTETTLILVTHSRDDALDLARRTLVLDQGRPVAQDTLESVLIRPRHAAAVRAFGLGQVLDGEVHADGTVATVFGPVSTHASNSSGKVRVLIRPAQPRIVSEPQGVEAEVVRIELLPPEGADVRRIAVVRAGGCLLRVFTRDRTPSPGDRLRVTVEQPCDLVVG
jgi:ABC-type Fe3+/spermidine/putrescine transport system ATPase subunit